MTTLVIVRHGQSTANLNKKFAGQRYDAELSELGHEQAKLTAEYIAENYSADKIYASDLKRAYSTAEHIAGRLGISEIHKTPGIREIYAGKWEGMEFSAIEAQFPKAYDEWKHNIGAAHCTDGETVAEMFERVTRTILDIAENNSGKTVLLATHATPIRAMECMFRGLGAEEMKNFRWVTNASVTVAEYENGKFRIVSVSEDGHLGGAKSSLPKNV